MKVYTIEYHDNEEGYLYGVYATEELQLKKLDEIRKETGIKHANGFYPNEWEVKEE